MTSNLQEVTEKIREPIDESVLDEWMYAIDCSRGELTEAGPPEMASVLQKALDDMRDRRSTLVLRKHNETGY